MSPFYFCYEKRYSTCINVGAHRFELTQFTLPCSSSGPFLRGCKAWCTEVVVQWGGGREHFEQDFPAKNGENRGFL